VAERAERADDRCDVEASRCGDNARTGSTRADAHHLDTGADQHAPGGQPLDQHPDEDIGGPGDAGGIGDLPATEGPFDAQPDGMPPGQPPRVLSQPGGDVEYQFRELSSGQPRGQAREALPGTQLRAHAGGQLLAAGELGLCPEPAQRLPGAVEAVQQVAPGDGRGLAEAVAQRRPLLAPVGGQGESGAVGEAVLARWGSAQLQAAAPEFGVEGASGLAEQVAPGCREGDHAVVGLAGDVDARSQVEVTLEDGHVVADLGQSRGSGKSGQPAADDSDQRAASQARNAVTPRRIWVSSTTASAMVPISRRPARIAACTG